MSSRHKQPDAAALPWATDGDLRAFAFANDQERLDAKMIAELYQLGYDKAASELLAVVGGWRRLLPLVLAELNGKRTKSDLKQTGIKIVRAWCSAAYRRYKRASTPVPTLFEVKRAYARAFVEERRRRDQSTRRWLTKLEERNEIPRDWTFRQTLARCELRWRKDRIGAPRK